MTTILSELAAREQTVCAYVNSLTGTLEAKTQQLAEAGIFTAYASIFTNYAAAYQDTTNPSERLEILKRLAFLSWYGLLEPSFISGIGELDEAVIRTTYAWLDELVRGQRLDAELRWMLSFYASWDYLLLPFIEPHLPALAAFMKAVDPTALHMPEHPEPWLAMDNRGQMGLYWQSIQMR